MPVSLRHLLVGDHEGDRLGVVRQRRQPGQPGRWPRPRR